MLITVFPHIVSSLEYFPPLNSFLTSVRKLFKFLLHKGKINEETIWNFQGLEIPKKNSCRGNYMRKYGILNLDLDFKTNIYGFLTFMLQSMTCNLFRLAAPATPQATLAHLKFQPKRVRMQITASDFTSLLVNCSRTFPIHALLCFVTF